MCWPSWPHKKVGHLQLILSGVPSQQTCPLLEMQSNERVWKGTHSICAI